MSRADLATFRRKNPKCDTKDRLLARVARKPLLITRHFILSRDGNGVPMDLRPTNGDENTLVTP